jgi:hypothetical protein
VSRIIAHRAANGQRELRRSCKSAFPTSGSGRVGPCSSSMARLFRCRTRR